MSLASLQGYPPDTVAQVQALVDAGRLGPWLQRKYPVAHGMRDDRALFTYVQALRQRHMKAAPVLHKVVYDSKLRLAHHALGTHTRVARVQGAQLKSKREIRIASLFKDAPLEFLRMIAVHELAHLKERDHDKNFYALCCHMEPDYHQLEFEVRMYLAYLETAPGPLWS